MKIFINGFVPDIEQYKFAIKTAVILTASNYARIKVKNIISTGVIDKVADYYINHYKESEITNKNSLREFIKMCSNILVNASLPEGFALFCINLINKKFSSFYTDEFKKILDAPLNRDELQQATKKISKMSDLSSNSNYDDVMNEAEYFALNKGFSSLFEWELKEYNK